MDTQTTYRGYVIRLSRLAPSKLFFQHPDAEAIAADRRRGYGYTIADCKQLIDHQIADAMALSDRDGGRA